MAQDHLATERIAPRTVFAAAGAILSQGRPLDSTVAEVLRTAMAAESVPADIAEQLLRRCAAGLHPEDVPVAPGLSAEQIAQFSAALTVFALRAAPQGDPIELASRLCAPYGVRLTSIEAFAREVASVVQTRDSDLAGHIQLLLAPPAALHGAIRRHLGLGGDERPSRRSVAHVSPRRIQHPHDQEATEALRELQGLDELVALFMKHAHEKMERVSNLGGRVRIGPQQLPDLYALFRGCVSRAGVRPEPELFLESGPINAYTFGADRPFIVLSSAALTQLSRPELEFVLGHELGHIRFRHVLYMTLARVLPRLATQLPFGAAIAKGIDLALSDWQRKAELSADRMGLLVCQEPDAALRVMVKLSGFPPALYPQLNVEAFLAQYDDFKAIDGDVGGLLAKALRSAEQDHPFTVVRAHEIQQWAHSGEYGRMLSGGARSLAEGDQPPASTSDLLPWECAVCRSVGSPDTHRCATCGGPYTERSRFHRCVRCGHACSPSLRFCESCGAPQSLASEESR